MEFNKYARAFAVAVLGLVGAFQVIAAENYRRVESGDMVTFLKNTPATIPNADVSIQNGQIKVNSPTAAGRLVAQGTVIRGTLDPLLLKPALARKLAGALPGVSTALALIEIADLLLVKATKQPDDTYKYSKRTRTIDETRDYRIGGDPVPWSRTSSQACDAGALSRYGPNGFISHTVVSDAPNCNVSYSKTNQPDCCSSSDYYQSRLTLFDGGSEQPISPADFADLIAAKSGWPSNSKVVDLIRQTVATEPVALEPTSITGPSSTPGPTSTSTAPDGKVTTNQTTNNYTYGPNSITSNVTTVSNIFNPVTNTTQVNGTTTVSPGTEVPKKTACEENPNALGCAELDEPKGDIPKVTKDVTYQAESMFSGGSCPPDVQIAQSLTGRPVVLSYTPTCNALANYVKPIIIAIALFMAYLIILPGSKS